MKKGTVPIFRFAKKRTVPFFTIPIFLRKKGRSPWFFLAWAPPPISESGGDRSGELCPVDPAAGPRANNGDTGGGGRHQRCGRCPCRPENEPPRRKRRGILADYQFFYAASGGEYNPKRLKNDERISPDRENRNSTLFPLTDPLFQVTKDDEILVYLRKIFHLTDRSSRLI